LLLASVTILSSASSFSRYKSSATPHVQLPPYELHYTAAGTEFGLISPLNATKPWPLAIILCNDINTTLASQPDSGSPDPYYYANICPLLWAAGWACASIDLPSHGKQVMPGEPEGIAGWRYRMDRGINFTSQNNARVQDVVDHLVGEGTVDASRVVPSGISRGGYMSAHYAASNPRIQAVSMLSPVTNLSLLSEFAGVNATMQTSTLRPLDLTTYSEEFASRINTWLIIGDQDTRVYTHSAIGFMRAVQCSGCRTVTQWGCTTCPAKAADNRLQVYREPKGHTVPPFENPSETYALAAGFVQRHTQLSE